MQNDVNVDVVDVDAQAKPVFVFLLRRAMGLLIAKG